MNNGPKKKNPVSAYSKTQVFTASRETLLLMLYDGAIRFIKKALEAGQNDNVPEKNVYIGKAIDIVTELQATLNHKAEAQISAQLDGLYGFIQDRLFRASREQDQGPLQEALNIFVTLRGAWDEAIQSLKPKPEL